MTPESSMTVAVASSPTSPVVCGSSPKPFGIPSDAMTTLGAPVSFLKRTPANLFDNCNSRTRHNVPQRHVETVVKNAVDIAGKQQVRGAGPAAEESLTRRGFLVAVYAANQFVRRGNRSNGR